MPAMVFLLASGYNKSINPATKVGVNHGFQKRGKQVLHTRNGYTCRSIPRSISPQHSLTSHRLDYILQDPAFSTTTARAHDTDSGIVGNISSRFSFLTSNLLFRQRRFVLSFSRKPGLGYDIRGVRYERVLWYVCMYIYICSWNNITNTTGGFASPIYHEYYRQKRCMKGK